MSVVFVLKHDIDTPTFIIDNMDSWNLFAVGTILSEFINESLVCIFLFIAFITNIKVGFNRDTYPCLDYLSQKYVTYKMLLSNKEYTIS